MRILLVVLAFGSLLALPLRPASAAPSVQMTVRAGFDGIGKIGGWTPIEVELRNDGPGEASVLFAVVAPVMAATPTP